MASSPEDAAGDGAVVAMAPLERLARERLTAGAQGARVIVRGQFVRRRKLSKGLVFSDIRLQDGELLEVMIRAQEGVLDFDAIRQINWDVHLGDTVTAHGVLQRKQQHHTQQDPAMVGEEDQPILFLLLLHSIRVDKRWSDHNSGAFLDHPTQVAKPSDAVEASSLGSLTLAPASRAVATTGEHSERAQSAPKYTNMVVIDGFNACKYYFSGAGGVNCRRGAQCHFWHGDPADFALNRQRWLEARTAQRAAASRIAGDDEVDPHSKAGKAHRARIFCDWLIENLGESKLRAGEGVLDIAGGKGDIPIELWNLRGIPTTLIDPRPMKLSKRSRRIIQESKRDYGRDVCAQLMCCLDAQAIVANASFLRNCSLFVGMHPDEATEAIVDTALELRIPFAIVPCCVMSRTFPDRLGPDGKCVETYEAFVEYLAAKHPHIQKAFLPFAGRNQVLYLFAYDQ